MASDDEDFDDENGVNVEPLLWSSSARKQNHTEEYEPKDVSEIECETSLSHLLLSRHRYFSLTTESMNELVAMELASNMYVLMSYVIRTLYVAREQRSMALPWLSLHTWCAVQL